MLQLETTCISSERDFAKSAFVIDCQKFVSLITTQNTGLFLKKSRNFFIFLIL